MTSRPASGMTRTSSRVRDVASDRIRAQDIGVADFIRGESKQRRARQGNANTCRRIKIWMLPVLGLCWSLLGAALAQGKCNEGEYLAGAVRNPSFEEYVVPPPSIWWFVRDAHCPAGSTECAVTPHWQKEINSVVTTNGDPEYGAVHGNNFVSLIRNVRIMQNLTLEPLTQYQCRFFVRPSGSWTVGAFVAKVEGSEIFRQTLPPSAFAWYTAQFTSLDKKQHELMLSQEGGDADSKVDIDIVEITNPAGDRCLPCDRGYGSQGEFCDDIDECSLPNACEHATCTNTAGSFFCTCNTGFSWNDTESRCVHSWTDGTCWFLDSSVPLTNLSDAWRWPVGTAAHPIASDGRDRPFAWNGTAVAAVTFVSTVSFPRMHQGRIPDGVLFEIAGSSVGLWAGILDNKLHIQVGHATAGIEQGEVANSTSYLTTECVPADGAPHMVVVDLDWERKGHLGLWIDRMFVGSGVDMAHNYSQWTESAAAWVGYGIGSGPVPAGTVGSKWVGELHHELLVYPGRTVGGCDVDTPAIVCPSCTDGVQNGWEAGVDCGGSCGECDPCKQGDAPLTLHNPSFEADAWVGGGAHQMEPSGWNGQGSEVVRSEYTCSELGGLLLDSGLCLVLSPVKFATWFGAEAECNALGGHLASIPSADVNDAAWDVYTASGFFFDRRVHIGLTNHPSMLNSTRGRECDGQPSGSTCNPYGNGLSWSDGSELTFSSFRGDADAPLSCASLANRAGDEDRAWELGSCWEEQPYLCAVPTVERDDAVSPSPCDELGGLQAPDSGRCFLVPDTSKVWAAAEEECVALGGHLASVRSQAEHSMVGARLARMAIAEAWIGLTSDEATVAGASAAEGVWKWVDNSTWTFTHWPENHVHNSGLRCAAMRAGTAVGEEGATWKQVNCASPRRFVCAVETGPPPLPTYSCDGTCVSWDCREDTSTPELVLVGRTTCSSTKSRYPSCSKTIALERDVDVTALLVTVKVQQSCFSGLNNRVFIQIAGRTLPHDDLKYSGRSKSCSTWTTVMDGVRLPDDLTGSTSLSVQVSTTLVCAWHCDGKKLAADVMVYAQKRNPPICTCTEEANKGAVGKLRPLDSSFVSLPVPGASISQALQLVRFQRYLLRFFAASSKCEEEQGGVLRVLLRDQELLRVSPEASRFQQYEVSFVAGAPGPLVFVNDGDMSGAPVFVDAVQMESRCPYAGDAGVDDLADSCGFFRNTSQARPSLLHYEFLTEDLLRDSSLFGRHAGVHSGLPVSTMAGCARGGCVYLARGAVLSTGTLRLDGTEAGLTIGIWWRFDGPQVADAVILEMTGMAKSGEVRGVRITVAAEGRAERLRLEHDGGHAEVLEDGELASGSWQQLRWTVSWDGWKVWLGSRLVAVRRGNSMLDFQVHQGFLGSSEAGTAVFRGWIDEVRIEPQAEHGDHAYMYHSFDAGRFGLDASVKGRHLPPPASGVWSLEPERECMFGSCAKVGDGQSLLLPALQINSVLNGLTVSLWFRRASMETKSAWAVLLDLRGEQNGRERIRFLLNLDGSSMLAALVEGVVDLVVDNAVVGTPGWHHVTLRVSVSEVQLMIDGISAEWDGIAPPKWTAQHGRVGALTIPTTEKIMGLPLQPFAGWVDELSIHDSPCIQIVPTCPAGWQAVQSPDGVARCLLAVEAPASFEAAAETCASLDAHLPFVSSQEECETVVELAEGAAWLGATVDSRGVLKWLDHTVATAPDGVRWKDASHDANARCLQLSGNVSCGEPTGPCHGFRFASTAFKGGAHEGESSGCSLCAGSSAIVLDGVDDYLDLETIEFGQNLSYTAWVKVAAAINNATVFDFGNESNANNHILALDARAQLAFVTTAGPLTQQVTSPSTLPLNQWAHVAVTIAGTTARLYIDGAEAASGLVFNLPVQNRSRSYIGKGHSEHAALFNGSIADFRMYRRAMSAEEVAAISDGSNLFSADVVELRGVSCHGRVAPCNTTTWWEKRECAEVARVVCQTSPRCDGERESAGAKCLSCACSGCSTRRRMCEGDPRAEIKPQGPYEISLHTVGIEKLFQVARQDIRDSVSDVYRDAGLLVEACDGFGRVWCLPTPQLHGTFDLRFPTSPWERQRERSRQVRAAGPPDVEIVSPPAPTLPPSTTPPSTTPPSTPGVDIVDDDAVAEEDGNLEAAYGAAAGGGATALALAVWYYRKKRRDAVEGLKEAAKTVNVRLVVVSEGKVVGEVKLVAGQEVTFGRESEPPLRMEHESCSGAHARFALAEDGAVLTVTDLDSRNGTRVDRRQLRPNVSEPISNGQNVVLAASPVVLLVAGLPDKPGHKRSIERSRTGSAASRSMSQSSRMEGGASASVVFDASNSRSSQERCTEPSEGGGDAGAGMPVIIWAERPRPENLDVSK